MTTASTDSSPARKTPLLTNILVGIVTLAMFASAGAKLAGAEQIVEGFQRSHIEAFILPIGVLEIIIAILFVIPKTSSLGTLLVTGYFGGAVVSHLAANQPAEMMPALVLGALAWVANYFRNRNMFESLTR
ncbi:MAG: DoxX family protein [Nannocystaceae bacterium]